MRFSRRTDYALRTVLDLAQQPREAVSRVAEIAARQNIPGHFLEQILLMLKGGGIVASRRGQRGGYYLLRAAEEITLADVIRLTEGQLSPSPCCTRADYGCEHPAACPIRELWQDVEVYLEQKLQGISVAHLRSRARELHADQAPCYEI